MIRRLVALLPILLLALALGAPATFAQNTSPTTILRTMAAQAQTAAQAADTTSPERLRAAYDELHTTWQSVENAVRERDPSSYVQLENALDGVKDAVYGQPLDPARVADAFNHLEQAAVTVAEQMAKGGSTATPATTSLAEFAASVNNAAAAIGVGNTRNAREHLEAAKSAWPAVEGQVATSSPAAYAAIEAEFGNATTALDAQPTNIKDATAALNRLSSTVAPFVIQDSYTAFDAASVLIREGVEALLIIAALLTVLRRTGNSNKRSWIWAGGLLGIAASIAMGFALQAIFSAASAGHNREIVEGVTGIVAAAMLFYVAYWLHSHASLSAWRKFIDERTSNALASGSLVGLALLAFLTVFREGAETVVFYLGMAPAISMNDLLLGLVIGVVSLCVVGVLVLVFSVRLPLRRFFQVAGLLVYYLGFKFIGTGIHALQVAGTLPYSPAPIPTIAFFGIYPTWETTLPQLVLIAGAIITLFIIRLRDRQALGETQMA